MIELCFVVAAAWMLGPAAADGAPRTAAWDYGPWRQMAVQDGGRYKPLETMAGGVQAQFCNSSRDPATDARLEPTAFYLALLFEWQGWDRLAERQGSSREPWRGLYFQLHSADRWDTVPLLRIDSAPLRSALGLPAEQTTISPQELSRAKIAVTALQETKPFLHWAEEIAKKSPPNRTQLEAGAVVLAQSLWDYQEHRMGKRLCVVPSADADAPGWLCIAQLLTADFGPHHDPTGDYQRAGQLLRQARAAYLAGSEDDFARLSVAFQQSVQDVGLRTDHYPAAGRMRLEAAYHALAPFRAARFAMLAALAVLVGAKCTGCGWLRAGAYAAYALAVAALIAGFGMRVGISGRAPIATMYESVVFVALGASLLGVVIEHIHREQTALTCASAVAALALALADVLPAAYGASIEPLEPVLRSNFWLAAHAVTMGHGFAALALAMGIGNWRLAYAVCGRSDEPLFQRLALLNYRLLQVGVLLLTAGMTLGAAWAERAWGRLWGWDPKEAWALITLLGYLALLHAMSGRWVTRFGLASLSVLCFLLVLMTWYGVNFVLRSGLHHYGFGHGGEALIGGLVSLQILFVCVAAARHWRDQAEPSAAVLGTAPRDAIAAVPQMRRCADPVSVPLVRPVRRAGFD